MGIMSAIKEWWNRMFKSEIKDQFQVTGITSGGMQKAIQNWMLIYKGEPDWVNPEEGVKTIKFAKFVCGEIARLATLAIDVTFDGVRKEYMTQFWEKSVHDRIREWTELMCACGTVVLKPNGTGVDLVTPDRFEITSLDGNQYLTAHFLYSPACFMINKIRKNGCYKFGERKAYPYTYRTEKSAENKSRRNDNYYISEK